MLPPWQQRLALRGRKCEIPDCGGRPSDFRAPRKPEPAGLTVAATDWASGISHPGAESETLPETSVGTLFAPTEKRPTNPALIGLRPREGDPGRRHKTFLPQRSRLARRVPPANRDFHRVSIGKYRVPPGHAQIFIGVSAWRATWSSPDSNSNACSYSVIGHPKGSLGSKAAWAPTYHRFPPRRRHEFGIGKNRTSPGMPKPGRCVRQRAANRCESCFLCSLWLLHIDLRLLVQPLPPNAADNHHDWPAANRITSLDRAARPRRRQSAKVQKR